MLGTCRIDHGDLLGTGDGVGDRDDEARLSYRNPRTKRIGQPAARGAEPDAALHQLFGGHRSIVTVVEFVRRARCRHRFGIDAATEYDD